MIEIVSSSEDQTGKVGHYIGQHLIGGELIILDGDLGSGKTTLTRGIVKGAKSTDEVSSPSFVIKNEYRSNNFIISHFDFYRLNDPGIMANLLNETINDNKFVSIIEWSNIVNDLLVKPKLTIKFLTLKETVRKIVLDYDKQLNYLIEGLIV